MKYEGKWLRIVWNPKEIPCIVIGTGMWVLNFGIRMAGGEIFYTLKLARFDAIFYQGGSFGFRFFGKGVRFQWGKKAMPYFWGGKKITPRRFRFEH